MNTTILDVDTVTLMTAMNCNTATWPQLLTYVRNMEYLAAERGSDALAWAARDIRLHLQDLLVQTLCEPTLNEIRFLCDR